MVIVMVVYYVTRIPDKNHIFWRQKLQKKHWFLEMVYFIKSMCFDEFHIIHEIILRHGVVVFVFVFFNVIHHVTSMWSVWWHGMILVVRGLNNTSEATLPILNTAPNTNTQPNTNIQPTKYWNLFHLNCFVWFFYCPDGWELHPLHWLNHTQLLPPTPLRTRLTKNLNFVATEPTHRPKAKPN